MLFEPTTVDCSFCTHMTRPLGPSPNNGRLLFEQVRSQKLFLESLEGSRAGKLISTPSAPPIPQSCSCKSVCVFDTPRVHGSSGMSSRDQ